MPVGKGLIFMEKGYEGQVISGQFDTFYRGTLGEATNTDTAIIPQGRFIINDPANVGGVKLATAAEITGGAEFIGIVPAQSFAEKDLAGSTEDLGVLVGRPVTYVIRGVMGMIAETNLNRGDAIYIRTEDEVAPAANEARGRIRNDDSGGNAALLPAGRASLLRDVLAGEFAELIIEFPPTLL